MKILMRIAEVQRLVKREGFDPGDVLNLLIRELGQSKMLKDVSIGQRENRSACGAHCKMIGHRQIQCH